MEYRLTWLAYWDEKQEHPDPRVSVAYTGELDNAVEHEYTLYLVADSDEEAKKKAREFVENSAEPIEAFSLVNRRTNKLVMTEAK